MDISNSEIETEQRCQYAHYYAFGLGLQSNRQSTPLQTGLLGHSILEMYYKALRATESPQSAYASTLERLGTMDLSNPIVATVADRFINYMSEYQHADFEDFQIVDVETLETIPIGDGINYRFTADLVVRLRHDMEVELASGAVLTLPQDGYVVIDHKFVGQMYTYQKLIMNVQIPKYIYALRALGYNVVAGMINQIGTTTFKLQRDWIAPTDTRIVNIMAENQKAATRIAAHNKLPVSAYRDVAERSFSAMVCPSCAFRLPCSVELNGGDATRILVTDFQENPYVSKKKVAEL